MCDTLESVEKQLAAIENDLSSDTNLPAENEYIGITLLDMPVEIILNICSFMDAVFLKNTLSHVCQRLQDILSDENLWKNWVHSRVKGYFPPIPQLNIWYEKPINWEEVCVEMDFEYYRWKNVKETMKHIIVKDMHYAAADTVLLVNNGEVCVSGSRDRSMALLKMSDIATSSEASDSDHVFYKGKPLKMRTDAHSGWVWDLAPDHPDSATIVYSASWDNSVKAWDLETFECIEKFGCPMSAVSVIGKGNEVMAGLYSQKVVIFDKRSGTEPVITYKAHHGAVLDLKHSGNMVASISDDKTMTIFDRVAGKIFKHVHISHNHPKAYPMCLSWTESALYVGDSKGYLNLFNPEEHVFMKSMQLWEQPPPITRNIKTKCLNQSEGTLIVGSDISDIKFFYNSYPPTEYASIRSFTTDITELCYQNGILAISTCESALEFWVPNDRYDNACP